ncbi:MAG: nucleotidyl transferase AbiEii/AbiGii toxin family protein [Neisseriaceae bacterium]|nr:nucleotidyl transferase AbiEii/AbiGii toxin family protein [Neisseriaceae bacterium]
MTLNLTAEERLHCEVMQACLNAIQKDKPLILKGGTALMLGYGLERFSEDLDFDIADTYTGKSTIKLDSVLKNALPYGVKLQELIVKKDTATVNRYILRYQKDDISNRLKIEVSYRTPVKSVDIVYKNGNMFLSVGKIADFKMATILDSNSDARTRARDLFDTAFIVQNYANEVNPALFNQLKQVDMNKLLSRYEQSFVEDKIMQRHGISADEVVLSLVENIQKISSLKIAKQYFQTLLPTLPESERNKILAYEKGASEIWERLPDEKTRNALATNFYTNAVRSIENGEKLPPAMSNAAAKEALENRRENNEPDINIDDDIEIDR